MISIEDLQFDNLTTEGNRKRKRKQARPFRDDHLQIAVTFNKVLNETSLCHSRSRLNAIHKIDLIRHFQPLLFDNLTHMFHKNVKIRHSKETPYSDKLFSVMKLVKRMKPQEETDPDLLNYFISGGNETLIEIEQHSTSNVVPRDTSVRMEQPCDEV